MQELWAGRARLLTWGMKAEKTEVFRLNPVSFGICRESTVTLGQWGTEEPSHPQMLPCPTVQAHPTAPGSLTGASSTLLAAPGAPQQMEPLPGVQGQPCPTRATHHGLCDFKDQSPSLVVGNAGCVEEVAGGSKVNHAFVTRGEGQWQW